MEQLFEVYNGNLRETHFGGFYMNMKYVGNENNRKSL